MLNNVRVNNEVILLNNVARVVMSEGGRATLYGVSGETVTYFDGEAGKVLWAFLSGTCVFSTDAPETTAPAPLPVDDSMSMHFVNGEVDYIEPGALIDNDMDELPY